MANITAKDVAELRAKTGIGMMECKKALVEANGDAEEAIKILRKRGELKAEAKAATRIAADGIVDVMTADGVTAIVEVNSETDFVAKNASFQEFVKNILKTIIANKPADVDALLASTYVDSDVTVDAKLKEMIFVIGEKLSIRRFAIAEGITSTYIHGAGSIGVVVSFEADGKDKFDVNLGKSLALLRLLRSVNRAVVVKLQMFDTFVKERTIALNEAGLIGDKILTTHVRNFNYSLAQEEHLIDTILK